MGRQRRGRLAGALGLCALVTLSGLAGCGDTTAHAPGRDTASADSGADGDVLEVRTDASRFDLDGDLDGDLVDMPRAGDLGDGSAPDGTTSSDTTDTATPPADTADVTPPPDPTPVAPPPGPVADDRVHVISVAIRTGTALNANTDSSAQICLSATQCYALDTPDINDRELGNTEVYHFEGLDVALSTLDRMTLSTPSTDPNNDRWSPACVEVRLDGLPVYCNDSIPVHIGTGASTNEVRSWTDPGGLHQACTTCQRGMLTHGPLVGPPGSDSLRVWVRTDATRLTGLRLGTSRDLSDAAMVAWAWPLPQDDFTADLVASDLYPDTEYFYRVEVDGDTSQPVRSIRTAPAADQTLPTRITIGSCSRLSTQPIFTPILAGQPDLFVFLGDNNYANTHFRDALRWRYREFRGLRERSEMVANTPTLAIWDDHDFLANNSNGTCVDRDEALAAFKEYWANPAHGTATAPGVFFNYRWGAVELFMLDCRMYRPDVGDPSRSCVLDPNPPTLPIANGPLGPEQEQWLIDGLASSDATFKLVACGSRFTPNGSVDSWASFDVARDRLFAAIDSNNIDGVVFLSGDIHRSMFKTVPTPGYSIPEITSSPLSYVVPATCSNEPNMRTCYDTTSSYVDLDIDPTLADPTLTARMRDDKGNEVTSWVILRSQLQ